MPDPRGTASPIGSGAVHPFLDALHERVLVLDGAFGTWMQGHDLGPDDFGGEALEGCNEYLVATRPDLVAQMHDEFFAAGVDGVETATFGAFPLVLNEYGLADQTFEINRHAAELAREVASGHAADGRPRFVIGSIGPGTRLPSLGQIRYDDAARRLRAPGRRPDRRRHRRAAHRDRLRPAAGEGRDQRRPRARCARPGLSNPIPIMVQVTVETTGRMLVGTEIGAALTALEAMRPDVIGMNCATGPAEMTEHLRYLAQHARTFLSALPNAGLPSVVDGHTHYDLTPPLLAEAHERFTTEFGLNVVGGCCGTTPEHLRQVVEKLDHRAPVLRTPEFEPGCSSIYSHVPFEQELAYLAIGERTNANGSRKFRDAMLEADFDTCVQMAREQVKEGAHVLDVCVDYVGRDGTIDMDEIAGRFATQASLPLVFDSTEPQVLEAGLQHHGGKALLNSANLEEGEDEGKRMDRVFRLAREYGAAVICLTIDEEGQARTADWKMRVAKRIYDIAIERYGLEADRSHLRPAHVPALDRRRRSPPRRDGDDRGDPPHQGRAARRAHRARLVERLVRTQARGAPRAEQRVPARVPRGRPRRRDRARGAHHAAAPHRRGAKGSRARSHLRPPARELRPAARSSWPCSRTSKPARSKRKTARVGRWPNA